MNLPISPNTAPHAPPSRFLPLLLAIAIFMQMLDATILNTALPAIAADLNESPLNMQSAVIVYTLTVALLIPLSGYLTDRFGTRTVFVASVVLFVTGSVLCAAAPNLPMLVFARAVQGLGGSMLAPVPRLTVMRVYDKSQLLNAINYAVMPALIGPVIGPLLGGYLVEYASWHWIFLLNVPIGIAGIIVALKIMPELKSEKSSLDLAGFLLFAAAACSLTLAVEIVLHPGAGMFALLLFAAAAAAFYGYTVHARRHENPLYAGHLLQVRTFRLGLAGNLFSRLGIGAVPFLLPLLLQVALGYSASASGWMLAPLALASLLAKPLIKPLLTRFGYRRVLLVNTALLGILMMMLALPDADTPLWLWLPLLSAMGLCNSVQFSTMNTLTIADLRPHQTGSGNSLMAVNQQLALGIGVALSALLLQLWRSGGWDAENVHTAFRLTFVCIGLLTFAAGRIFSLLHRSDGENLTS